VSELPLDRKEQILAAAADLVARKGYHAVSVSDIGSAAGVTGPAIYRHFAGKPAVLVALFDRAVDQLIADAHDIAERADGVERTLLALVEKQVDFVVVDRVLAQVYYNEIHNLPSDDAQRLRRKQRLYLEEWVYLVSELWPELDEADVRTRVHAAIGAIQSALFHSMETSDTSVRAVLKRAAQAVLQMP